MPTIRKARRRFTRPHREAFRLSRLLLDSGARINSPNTQTGATPLNEAALKGRADIAELLLAHHADAGAKDKSGLLPALFRKPLVLLQQTTFVQYPCGFRTCLVSSGGGEGYACVSRAALSDWVNRGDIQGVVRLGNQNVFDPACRCNQGWTKCTFASMPSPVHMKPVARIDGDPITVTE